MPFLGLHSWRHLGRRMSYTELNPASQVVKRIKGCHICNNQQSLPRYSPSFCPPIAPLHTMADTKERTGEFAGFKFYHYLPSAAAALLFTALFGLSTIMHIYQMARTRTWFVIPFILGGLCEWLRCDAELGLPLTLNVQPVKSRRWDTSVATCHISKHQITH